MNNISRPLRVGVVGCGSFGRHAYSDNVVDHSDANLTAVCDVDAERAETVARELFDAHPQRPRAATYTDYQEMLDQESLDIVMVGTMADVRSPVTIAALNSGAHVLAAKPMAPSLAEAESMLQAAEQAGRMLMVGYNFRFRQDAQAVHNFVRSGGLGTPRFARTWIHAGSVPGLGTTLHQVPVRGWFTRKYRCAYTRFGGLVPRLSPPPLRRGTGERTFC